MTDIDAVCEAVIQAKNAEIEKLMTELVAMRPIVAAAVAWRPKAPNPCWDRSESCSHKMCALVKAIDAAQGKL